ncbi:MAG: hypothetical protein H6672_11560 [Anaerolineaceae bacterium]|nr:hypothetical protein [Anaerolineaceae bacterium]
MPTDTTPHFPEISIEDLPHWMRQAQRGVDWGLLLALGFSLLVAWPFIFRPGLPPASAARSMVYRTSDYAMAIMEGQLYSRWSPNAFGGYGAPIPNFYPPAAPYSAALLKVLFTADSLSAVRLMFIFAVCMAGVMTYLFVSRRTTAAAGLLASILYVTQPYVGLTVPHIQGDLEQALALAWLPALLWSSDRLLRVNRPLDMLLTAVLTMLLFITDIPLGVTGIMLALVLAVWHRRFSQGRVRFRILISTWMLGILLGGFFWVPAFLEQGGIRWLSPTIPDHDILTLSGLLTPASPLDRSELRPESQLTLGILGIVVIVGVGGGIVYFRRYASFEALFLVAGWALLLGALLVAPGVTWVLGPAALCISISGGGLLWWGGWLKARRRLLLPALLVTVWMVSLPVWTPPEWPETFGGESPIDQIQFEQQGYGPAVLPPGVPVPTTLPDTLTTSSFLVDGFRTGSVNKIAPGQAISTLQVGLLAHGTHSDRLQIHTAVATSLTILTAYFPGWQAELDGRSIPLSRDPDNGLIRVDVPATRSGELLITLGLTPIRSRAWLLSGLALGVLLVMTWGRWRRQRPVYRYPDLLPRPETRLVGLVLLSCTLVVILFALHPSPLSARPAYRLSDSIFINSRTNAGLGVLAYHVERTARHPGETLDVTIYWLAQRPLLENYQVRAYLLDLQTGAHWSETPLHNPGDYPTRLWLANRYVTDTYRLALPPTMEAGNYGIAFEVFACDPTCTGDQRLTFFNNVGQSVGSVLVLPSPITLNR